VQRDLSRATGAAVMATGIVSVDLALDGHETLSHVLLGIAAAAWAWLLARAALDPARVRREAGSPAELSDVAATAVIGTRIAQLGWRAAAAVLLVLALAMWLARLGPVLRDWTAPATGVSFMLTVSTEGLAVLAASLTVHGGAAWVAHAAIAPFVLGLGFYAFVLRDFDGRQLLLGRGDHWVGGGALAISALAAGQLSLAGALPDPVVVVLWIAAMLWLPALIVAELVRPRTAYDARRWSTVFPLGMYGACTFTAGDALGADALSRFATVWTWVAFAAWLVVLAAAVALNPGRTSAPAA
jgi:Voltage-dependent anion channel